MTRLRPVIPLVLAALAGCAPAGVRVERAWIRDADSCGTTAAYFTLINDGATPASLTGIAAPCARRAEVHRTVREDGRAAMREVRSLDLAPGARVEFVPGGHHVMLISTTRRLAEGDTASLILSFADGRTRVVRAEVRR